MSDYDFRGLSPIDFEALVRDLLSTETGKTFETYAVGRDGGIDCRHVGADGTAIAQCKHRPDATKAQMVSSAKAELTRLGPDPADPPSHAVSHYYFVTSASLSPAAVDEVLQALGDLGDGKKTVWARGRLNALLTTHTSVERRHFKLWLHSAEVFDRIVGSGEWERNEALVHDIKERVAVYVHTPKFEEANDALHEERVVLISGPPGAGKSTLAEMLLLNHWEAGWKVMTIASDAAEAWRHVRDHPDDKVIFYYDDFLGQTSSLELQKNEASDLGRLIRAVRRSKSGNLLLIMTSREQVLQSALAGPDDRVARALTGQETIRVELERLSRSARARMLFNHLYFAYRGTALLTTLATDARYRSIIDHPGFNPRVLESIVLLKRPESVDSLYDELSKALDHPESLWNGSFQQLSHLAVRLLLVLAIDPRRAVPTSELEAIASAEDPRALVVALRVLEGTWVRIDATSTGTEIRLYDPSRRDFLLDQLQSGPMFLAALNQATSIHQLAHLARYRERPAIAGHMRTNANSVDARATELLTLALEQAAAAEAERSLQIENFEERMAALISGVAVVTRAYNASRLEAAIPPYLEFLNDEFSWRRFPRAASLFELAEQLSATSADWSRGRAAACVRTGAGLIENTDELRAFADLPAALSREADPDIDRALDQAVQRELEAIEMQSDREVMAQWLDEVEEIASDLGFSIETTALREQIEEMPESSLDANFSAVQSGAGAKNADDSDWAIAQLFARLSSEDA